MKARITEGQYRGVNILKEEKLGSKEMEQLKGMIESGDETNMDLAFQILEGFGVSEQEFIDSEYGEMLDVLQYNHIKGALLHVFTIDVLDINQKGLSEFPEWVEKFKDSSYLVHLRLMENHIERVPEYIGKFKKLKGLHLEENQIEYLPDSMGEMSSLEFLKLNDNNISELPERIGNLKNLKQLYMKYNNLTELPDSIGELDSLKILDLSGNYLETIPESMKGLKNLYIVNLENNNISNDEKKRIKQILPNVTIYF